MGPGYFLSIYLTSYLNMMAMNYIKKVKFLKGPFMDGYPPPNINAHFLQTNSRELLLTTDRFILSEKI